MRGDTELFVTFIITALAVAADQITKYIVKTNMQVGESFNLIKYILNIKYIENPGASFGMLADHRLLLMVFSSAALVFVIVIIFYLNKKEVKKYNGLPSIALAFILGGGVGNMIDRLFNESEVHEGVKVVVDFLEFDFVDFYIFNLADTFITVGSVLLCAGVLLGKYKINKTEETDETEETEEADEL